MERLRKAIQRGMLQVDRFYCRRHHLQPVGEVLLVGRSRYHGAAKQFPDGTCLAAGDAIGTLHFHNERFTRLDGSSARKAALQFRRLMQESLQNLADKVRHDRDLHDLAVYSAVSWLPPHGARVGFITQPFPPGLRKRLLSLYFRVLVWAFAPAAQSRAAATPEPTVYWMTREELLRHTNNE